MNLLFTGGTGFVGQNIKPLLEQNYKVTTCGNTSSDTVKANLAEEIPAFPERYDVVLHACGKAHSVPKTEAEIQVFYDVNFQGSVNLCKALEKVGVPKSMIFISTVAVYGCDFGELINENHPLDGKTPYAKSKIMAEEFLIEWCKKNDVILGILRPSLLAGPGAPGNLGEMVNSINRGLYVNVAGGMAKKSVLMVQDIANLIFLIVDKGGIYNVCDTSQPSFGQLADSVTKQLGKRKPISIPYWMAWCLAKCGSLLGSKAPINNQKLKKITESLTFSNEKARRELGWEPLDVLTNFKV